MNSVSNHRALQITIVLLLVWLTPAVIAGILGWRGIWGGTSAFFDYLIPVPVAGGVLHVPGFIVAATVLVNLNRIPQSIAQFVPLIAMAVFLFAQTCQLDFERLNDALFTDYDPYGSIFRFGSNPFYLFVATDALWVAAYALLNGVRTRWPYWLLLPLVPVALMGAELFQLQSNSAVFTYGFSTHGSERGDEISMVHTSNVYEETLFRNWVETNTLIHKPWNSPNAEHLAILFTSSMQSIKWRKTDDNKNVVGTVCVFEEDRSLTSHAGYYDCFADRLTVAERMARNVASNSTGFGQQIDQWFAGASLCQGVEIPQESMSDIALFSLCRRLKQKFPEMLERTIQQSGEGSEQVLFIKSKAELLGWPLTK